MSCVRLWGGIKSPRAVLEVVDQRTQLDQTGRPDEDTTFADQEEASYYTTHKHMSRTGILYIFIVLFLSIKRTYFIVRRISGR